MVNQSKKINLALQGGGSHGALTWGIIDKFLEDGQLEFEGISATSAGAMNATILAMGLANGGREAAREALYNFWKDVSLAGELYSPIKPTIFESLLGIPAENSISAFLVEHMTHLLSPSQLNPFNFNPLRDVLNEHVDFFKIRKMKKLKLFISATNVKTGKIEIFDNQKISVDCIMASACLPFLFPSVNIGENYYWDGGYMGNPALFPLIYNCQCKDILTAHINPIKRDNVPDSSWEILNRMNEISFNSSLMREMRVIAFITNLIEKKWIKDEYREELKRIYVHSIRADISMQNFSVRSKLNPSWPFLLELYEKGREEATKWLKNNFASIGKQSTIDLQEFT